MSICRQCQRDPDEYDRTLRRQAKEIDDLRTCVVEQGQQLSDQQAIHEVEMAQDGRARAVMIALCRELGVAIFGDAAEGIRNEVARLRAGHRPEDSPTGRSRDKGPPIPDCICGHLWAHHHPGGDHCAMCECVEYEKKDTP